MTLTRTLSTIGLAALIALPLSSLAAAPAAQDDHHPEAASAPAATKAAPAKPGPGKQGAMPGYAGQMRAMQQMHEKMLAAKTPEERNALMAEQMKLMESSMTMMGRMGPGAMHGGGGHMMSNDGSLEQRMDMMQSMMQMMMDRMEAMSPSK